MNRYEVKAWITVEATTTKEAEAKAAAILDTLPEEHVNKTSIEGEGAVYEIDEDDV